MDTNVSQKFSDEARRGADTLVRICGRLDENEAALVIADSETLDIAELVAHTARSISSRVDLVVEPPADMHGSEPSAETAKSMAESDLIFCLTSKSLAHSAARLKATEAGARYLSLPDYSVAQLESPALDFDFTSLVEVVNEIAVKLDGARSIRVTTPLGTDVEFRVDERTANRAPGFVSKPGDLSSPPDAEVNVAPIESTAHGTIYVDGSIPCNEVGLLATPVKLTLEGGRIVDVESESGAKSALEDLFAKAGPKSRILGEFGLGLNPKARLCGRMLEDEGCAGTIHFGFGSNATIGGTNKVNFHLDFIVRNPTVHVDGTELTFGEKTNS